MISFKLQRGNKAAGCEDAPPIATSSYCIVCDGVGGSGSTKHQGPDADGEMSGQHTSAYFGARIVAHSAEQFYKSVPDIGETLLGKKATEDTRNSFLRQLKASIRAGMEHAYSAMDIKPLPSRTLKIFPTTFASAICYEADSRLKIMAVWAGDSRVYLLSPSKGLQLLTVDDAEGAENKMNSGTGMNNYLFHGADFRFNYALYDVTEPCLILCCTDGCFDYKKSPLHFEWTLLKAVTDGIPTVTSYPTEELLKNAFFDYLCKQIGDDTTMAGMVYGFESIDKIKNCYRTRLSSFEHEAFAMNTAVNAKKEVDKEKSDADRACQLYGSTVEDGLRTECVRAINGMGNSGLQSQLVKFPVYERYEEIKDASVRIVDEESAREDAQAQEEILKLRNQCLEMLTYDKMRYQKERESKKSGLPRFVSILPRSSLFSDPGQAMETLEALSALYAYPELPTIARWHFRDNEYETVIVDRQKVISETISLISDGDSQEFRDLWSHSYFSTSAFCDEKKQLINDPFSREELENALLDPAGCPYVSKLTMDYIRRYQASVARRSALLKKYEEQRSQASFASANTFYEQNKGEIQDALFCLSPDALGILFEGTSISVEKLVAYGKARSVLNGIEDRVAEAQANVDTVWERYRPQYELFKTVDRKGVR